MTQSDQKFWPYRPRTSFVSAVVILVGLLLIQAITRKTIGWPGSEAETAVLIGIVVFSLLPIVLAMLDVLIERGGAVEIKGVKIDFAKPVVPGMSGMTVPVNVGLPGQPVTEGGTIPILDTLRQAMGCEAVIIDLADGQAWWETRLLVLVAGAVRIGKPEKAIFLATDGRANRRFQGWADTRDLLPPLLSSHPQYLLSYQSVMAASRQWSMVEPVGSNVVPPNPPWMTGNVALKHAWMAFDVQSGLPNALYPEQLLASELGEHVERQEQVKRITLVRMEELFRPILHRDSIDEGWPDGRQLKSVFEGDAPYVAITRNGEYVRLVSRLTILSSIVEKLAVPS
jgi:hypothetical protein